MDRKIAIRAAAAAGVVAAGVLLVRDNRNLQVTSFDVYGPRLPQSFDGLCIAQVSDLHNASFGRDNRRLLEALRQAKPDLIALTGDLIDRRRPNPARVCRLAAEAATIAPCYFVPGNHEAKFDDYPSLRQALAAAGVQVLENRSVPFARGGACIRIAGLSDPAFFPGETREQRRSAALAQLPGLLQHPEYTVLLCHRPELFENYADGGVDLALCGHAHGGQVRLPLFGGVLAPEQGLFPHYDAGRDRAGHTTMVVSRGLGNSSFPLRCNNRPELVLVRLHQ